jgi:hypothetical protein
MFSHMYALVFGCLQPSFPLAERICRLEASQNASSILVARFNQPPGPFRRRSPLSKTAWVE